MFNSAQEHVKDGAGARFLSRRLTSPAAQPSHQDTSLRDGIERPDIAKEPINKNWPHQCKARGCENAWQKNLAVMTMTPSKKDHQSL